MRKHAPNVLTLSRLPIAASILFFGWQQNWSAATVLLLAGLATDGLDGFLARRWNAYSDLGRDVLEPVCDAVLGATAVVVLCLTGVWSWWVLFAIIAIAATLQAISRLDDWARQRPNYGASLIRRLKRHQYWVHPYLFVVMMMASAGWYVWQATFSWMAVAIFGLAVALTVWAKRDRLIELMQGPSWYHAS